MRPVPIEDSDLWEGAIRTVIGPPRGYGIEVIPPVEVIRHADPAYGSIITVKVVIEEDDARRIVEGERTIWYSVYGEVLQAFDIQLPREAVPVEPYRCVNCGWDIEPLTLMDQAKPYGWLHHGRGGRGGGAGERPECDDAQPVMGWKDEMQ